MQISVESLEYVHVAVGAAFGTAIDPTADTVQMAFPVHGVAPVTGDWKSANWLADSTLSPSVYYARCLVGTGGTIALIAGDYDVYLKITDNPEIPVRLVGRLSVV